MGGVDRLVYGHSCARTAAPMDEPGLSPRREMDLVHCRCRLHHFFGRGDGVDRPLGVAKYHRRLGIIVDQETSLFSRIVKVD